MAATKTLRNARALCLSVSVHPTRQTTSRAFSKCAVRQLNPLFNLSAFSGSKEAQYFSKERRIPRTEFAPHLELIRASEVDPFAPTAGASPTVIAALRRAQRGETDKETAYALAISNLVQQLEASREDVKQAKGVLVKLQHKLEKTQRESLLLMFSTAGILLWVAFNTNFFGDIKDFFKRNNVTVRLLNVEYQTRSGQVTSEEQDQTSPLEAEHSRPLPPRTPIVAEVAKANTRITDSQTLQIDQFSIQKPSFLSSLFWAPSDRN